MFYIFIHDLSSGLTSHIGKEIKIYDESDICYICICKWYRVIWWMGRPTADIAK